MNVHTIVAGGGLAGLAAAAGLALHGVQVTVLESRPRLGGRAASFEDRSSGQPIDNCQHVSMGCCHSFRRFCELTGLDSGIQRQQQLYFAGPDGAISPFAAASLPAPFHLFPALKSLTYLSREDRSAIARGLRDLCRLTPQECKGSFLEWLESRNQPETAVRLFWEVVLVSALSESLDRIDMAFARQVFVEGFLSDRTGWQVEIPVCPLDQLYQERLSGWLTRHGAQVRLQTGAAGIHCGAGGRAEAVTLRNGESLTADEVVCAVPWYRVRDLLPPQLQQDATITRLEQIESAPITSVHLWFDRPWTSLPHTVLTGRFSQWMFNRTLLGEGAVAEQPVPGQESRADTPAAPGGWYCQIVISASREVAALGSEEAVRRVLADLAEVWPESASCRLLHSRTVTEHRAVFAPLPGIDQLRPAQQTAVENIQLAGDWTRTGWPATMEGAVRSGFLAAENILARHGLSVQLIPPPVRPALLSRILLGLKTSAPSN